MADKIPNRQDWSYEKLLGCDRNPLKDKERLVWQHKSYMLSRLNQLFEWDGLPETIPQKEFEWILLMQGKATIADVHNKGLYAFQSNLGGILNPYYLPTQSIVVNPYLPFNKVLEVDKDCVVIRNTSTFTPINDMLDLYANMLAEIDISLRIATVNSRISSLISVGDEATKDSATKFLEDIEKGKLGVIATNKFMESLKGGLNAIQYAGTISNIQDLIELRQYILATWFNQLGLNANYNMKREAINESEADLNEEALMPLIDDMLQCRQEGAKKVNAMFGTNLSVKLNSSWKLQRKEIETSMELAEKELNTEENEETQEEGGSKEEPTEDKEKENDND